MHEQQDGEMSSGLFPEILLVSVNSEAQVKSGNIEYMQQTIVTSSSAEMKTKNLQMFSLWSDVISFFVYVYILDFCCAFILIGQQRETDWGNDLW